MNTKRELKDEWEDEVDVDESLVEEMQHFLLKDEYGKSLYTTFMEGGLLTNNIDDEKRKRMSNELFKAMGKNEFMCDTYNEENRMEQVRKEFNEFVQTPATVQEIIDKLQQFPPDFPCFFRPKYHGTVEFCDDVPVHLNGISEMHPDDKPKNVTFLC